MNNLDYQKVESFVKSNSWDLEVFSNFMDFGIQKPKDYITIHWNQFNSKELPTGKFLTGKHKSGERFSLLLVCANSPIDRAITLLHEYGHYTSDQSGNVISDEINAWRDCLHWMKSLGIKLTFRIKQLVSKCLGTYLDVYGHTKEVLKFFKEYAIPYKVSEDVTYLTLPQPKLLQKFCITKDRTRVAEKPYGKENWK